MIGGWIGDGEPPLFFKTVTEEDAGYVEYMVEPPITDPTTCISLDEIKKDIEILKAGMANIEIIKDALLQLIEREKKNGKALERPEDESRQEEPVQASQEDQV